MRHFAFQNTKGVSAVDSQLFAGGAVNGNIIDRLGFQSLLISLGYGATTGTPTGTAIAWIVQHGAAANLSDAATFATLTALGAADANFTAGECVNINLNLEGAKRYIRIVPTLTFTAGTTPKLQAAVVGILADSDKNPQPSASAPVTVI